MAKRLKLTSSGRRRGVFAAAVIPMTRALAIAIPLTICPACLFGQTELIGRAEVKVLEWGGVEHRWDGVYSLRDVRIVPGPMGRLDVVLADNAPTEGEGTDLLIHFDDCARDRLAFVSDRYTAEKVDVFPSGEIRKHGPCAAGFIHERNVVRVKPLGGSLFFDEGPLGSFTVDFHLYPITFADGDEPFSWHAPVVSFDGDTAGIRAFAEGGRLAWQIRKVFKKRNGDYVEIVVREDRTAPLNEWHHHALSYDADTGLLSLFFDGRESAVAWVTESGRQKSTLLVGKITPHLGAPMKIGGNFSGYLDEFRISRGMPRFFTGDYRRSGEATSDVIDLGSPGAKLVKVSWKGEENNGTAVRVSCRVSDSYYPPTADRRNAPGAGSGAFPADRAGGVKGYPEWVQVKNGEILSGILPAGRYFQWKALLLGTGDDSPFVRGTGSVHTPVLSSLAVMIEPDEPPVPPVVLKAVPLDGAVRITWLRNKESDIKGYRIYYGPASRYYFGKGADLGDSPAPVGNAGDAVLGGLENEQVYFVAVTALDAAGQESGFSRELVVRPSQIFGNPPGSR
jgi:hypothetical protein